jgi:hypothetical protein
VNRIEKVYEIGARRERTERQWREFARAGGLPVGAFDIAFEPLANERTRLSIIAQDEDDTVRRVERTVERFRRFLGFGV